jgi:hypothetical protein
MEAHALATFLSALAAAAVPAAPFERVLAIAVLIIAGLEIKIPYDGALALLCLAGCAPAWLIAGASFGVDAGMRAPRAM